MGRFIAYRHTGADPERLEVLLPTARNAFAERGEETYCTYFDEANFKSSGLSEREIMDHAFAKIEEPGGLFVIIDGPEKSDGMIMEVGYCIAKAIPFVVGKRDTVTNTYLHKMTDNSFEYSTDEELKSNILNLAR